MKVLNNNYNKRKLQMVRFQKIGCGGRKLEWDKKIAITLSGIIGMVLIGCTVVSGIIYQRLLPEVRMVEAVWQDGGYVLPKDALYESRNGDCIYGIEEKKDKYQIKFILKEVLVTILKEDVKAKTVTVRGIYNPEWKYAAGADKSIGNDVEVKIIP